VIIDLKSNTNAAYPPSALSDGEKMIVQGSLCDASSCAPRGHWGDPLRSASV